MLWSMKSNGLPKMAPRAVTMIRQTPGARAVFDFVDSAKRLVDNPSTISLKR
jgi:hypothetical protein